MGAAGTRAFLRIDMYNCFENFSFSVVRELLYKHMQELPVQEQCAVALLHQTIVLLTCTGNQSGRVAIFRRREKDRAMRSAATIIRLLISSN